MSQFQKATKKKAKLRLAIAGPSGSGKSMTALRIAKGISERRGGAKICAVDTEKGSLSLYEDIVPFDVSEFSSYEPQNLVAAIEEAEKLGYGVMIIDSLSHFWFGEGGELDQVNKAAKRSQSQNTYFAWRDVSPVHNQLVEAMLKSKMDIIVTMRVKTEYVIETDSKGRQVPKKIGLKPIMRDGIEYEFTVTADVNIDNDFIVAKTRCPALNQYVGNKVGEDVADILMDWLEKGEAVLEPVFQLAKDTREKLLSVGATDEQIAEIKSVDEARRLYASLKSNQRVE